VKKSAKTGKEEGCTISTQSTAARRGTTGYSKLSSAPWTDKPPIHESQTNVRIEINASLTVCEIEYSHIGTIEVEI
jgi:hypothetical protein